MIFSAHGLLEFSSAGRRNGILTNLETRIENRPRWQSTVLTTALSKTGGPAIRIDMRFLSRADLIDLRDFIEANAVGPNTPVAGSWVMAHDCGRDDQTPCRLFVMRNW